MRTIMRWIDTRILLPLEALLIHLDGMHEMTEASARQRAELTELARS